MSKTEQQLCFQQAYKSLHSCFWRLLSEVCDLQARVKSRGIAAAAEEKAKEGPREV